MFFLRLDCQKGGNAMYLGEVCFILFFFLLFYFIWMEKSAKYSFQKVKRINGWYGIFYKGIMYPVMKLRRRFHWRVKGDRLDFMKKVYVGKGEEDIFCLYYGKMACLIAAVFMCSLFLLSAGSLIEQKGKLIEKYFLERDSVLGQEKTVTLSAEIDGDAKEVVIPVSRKQYTDKQFQKKLKEAKTFVNQQYLGENTSPESITKPLNLVTQIDGNAINISWRLDADGLIGEDGSIHNEKLEEKQQIEIQVIFSYCDIEKSVTKMLTILPKERTKEEWKWESWQKELQTAQEKSKAESYLRLPDKAAGKKVSYKEKKIQVSHMIAGASLFFMVMMILLQEDRMRKEIQRREKELRMDYPEFVEHFVLLVGAGLNVKGAWERIAGDYKNERKERHYVYEEMLVSMREMENGMGEARAYELFGKRTGLLQYMKFCTLIVQNLKKGSDDLLRLLDYEVEDAFRERKENAKALGEEAGTKLLLPMMLMMVIVFALILYAAFYSM